MTRRASRRTGAGSRRREGAQASQGDGRWRIAPAEDGDPAQLVHRLRERVKELNCLYGISHLAEQFPHSLDDILQGVVGLLPPAWQYPEAACARVLLQGRTRTSDGFAESEWRQSAPILVAGEPAGEVSVFYRDPRPAADEGPFLREERTLINAVADYLGLLARRIGAEEELHESNRLLTVEREALRESNIALRTVLARIDEEKHDMRRSLHANVERVLLPILHALSLDLPARKRSYVDLLRSNLLDITTPFTGHLTSAFRALTPTEVAICNMIRSGLRTKEIARLRSISAATVSRHREHIRRKLGLANKAQNLTTFLQSTDDATGTPGPAR